MAARVARCSGRAGRCGRLGLAGLWLASAGAMAAGAAAPAPQLLWQHDGVVHAAPAAAANVRAPLGSVWKLFVYSYLVATDAAEPPYRCAGAERRRDDEYCCDPGEAVDRDTALQRSCGAYFEPQRLALTADAWRAFWRARAGAAPLRDRSAPRLPDPPPDWLLELRALQPATVVEVPALLAALRQVPADARTAARAALLPNTLRDAGVLAALGSGPRWKTWSWTDAAGQRIGGGAGWLADGAPFWFGAAGTGRSALRTHAPWLAAQWQPQQALTVAPDAAARQAEPCVDVNLFARYPLAEVRRDDGRAVPDGPLAPGGFRLRFANGQTLALRGQPELRLQGSAPPPRLDARLALEDYVARVVDREGDARQTEAARALAVAARSWLLQNAAQQGGCYRVDDDSRAQRVSPHAPSAPARAAAAFTADLVVSGAAVRYHADAAAPGVLGWQQAVGAGRAGQGFEAMLRAAYPGATLAGRHGSGDCVPLPQARAWLLQRQARWRERLRAQPGYEEPGAALQVCQLQQGMPHADTRRLRIHLREWHSRDGRVTLIHEYLHLALRHHPQGHDEAFVERLAQILADS